MRRLLRALLAGALLVGSAACGDDDPAATPSDGATEEDSAEERALDDAVAARAALDVLEARLVERGFEAGSDDEDDGDDLEFTSEECQALDQAFSDDEELPGETASVDLDPFERGTFATDGMEETVEASVGVVEEPGQLDPVFELFGDPRVETCLEEAFNAAIAAQDGSAPIRFETTGFDVVPSELGEGGVSIGMDGAVEGPGVSLPISLDIEIVRTGRAAVFVMTSALGGPPSIGVDELVTVAIEELAEL